MQQMRWIDLLKDFDCRICYHPRNENVVTDALIHKSIGMLTHLTITEWEL